MERMPGSGGPLVVITMVAALDTMDSVHSVTAVAGVQDRVKANVDISGSAFGAKTKLIVVLVADSVDSDAVTAVRAAELKATAGSLIFHSTSQGALYSTKPCKKSLSEGFSLLLNPNEFRNINGALGAMVIRVSDAEAVRVVSKAVTVSTAVDPAESKPANITTTSWLVRPPKDNGHCGLKDGRDCKQVHENCNPAFLPVTPSWSGS